jgi:hypothetical protein
MLPRFDAGMKFLKMLCWVQGMYFLATGVWPLVSIGTFEMVTGPKTDDWLVKTVGVLIIVTSAVLLRAALSGKPSDDTIIIGAGMAAALMFIDLIYVSQNTILAIYLADAVLELIFVVAWAWCGREVLRKG